MQAQANAAQLQQQASLYAQQARMGLSSRGGKICSSISSQLISMTFLSAFLDGGSQGKYQPSSIYVWKLSRLFNRQQQCVEWQRHPSHGTAIKRIDFPITSIAEDHKNTQMLLFVGMVIQLAFSFQVFVFVHLLQQEIKYNYYPHSSSSHHLLLIPVLSIRLKAFSSFTSLVLLRQLLQYTPSSWWVRILAAANFSGTKPCSISKITLTDNSF